jgi:hypothetical protein
MAKFTIRNLGTIDLGGGRWLVSFEGSTGSLTSDNATIRFVTTDTKFIDSLVPGDLFAVELTPIRDVDPAPH